VRGIEPGYEQKTFSTPEKQGVLRLVASPDAAQGAVKIHADARMYSGLLDGEQTAVLPLAHSRKGYVHLVRGSLEVNGTVLASGDAALLQDESEVRLTHAQDAEVLVFDLQA
jgi:hypothetical protein